MLANRTKDLWDYFQEVLKRWNSDGQRSTGSDSMKMSWDTIFCNETSKRDQLDVKPGYKFFLNAYNFHILIMPIPTYSFHSSERPLNHA